MTKSLGIVIESFHCVFSFILSHTYLRLYSDLAEKEIKKLPCFERHAYPLNNVFR